MRHFLLLTFGCLFILSGVPAHAEDLTAETPDSRLELAEKLQTYRPVKDQVDAAIEKFLSSLPADQKAAYRQSLKEIINYKTLEKASIDAYAEVYSSEELQAMIDYYSKPEAQSALEKTDQYASKVYPEIIKMIDKGLMKAKTGG